jgi:hypothetical protein
VLTSACTTLPHDASSLHSKLPDCYAEASTTIAVAYEPRVYTAVADVNQSCLADLSAPVDYSVRGLNRTACPGLRIAKTHLPCCTLKHATWVPYICVRMGTTRWIQALNNAKHPHTREPSPPPNAAEHRLLWGQGELLLPGRPALQGGAARAAAQPRRSGRLAPSPALPVAARFQTPMLVHITWGVRGTAAQKFCHQHVLPASLRRTPRC